MRNVARERGKTKLEPPMTPMIDIIFNLLIFFLLTPTFRGGEGYLTTNLPKTSGPSSGPQTKVQRVEITLEEVGPEGKDVAIILNKTEDLGNNFDSLKARLDQFRSGGLGSDYPVLISPTMAVRHKWVVKAFDTAIAARFSNINFAVPR